MRNFTSLMVAGIVCVSGFSISARADDKSRPVSPSGNPGTWFRAQDYPPDAKRAGEQGRVIVELSIDPQGKPVGCQVVAGSGHVALDNGTCELAMRRAQFVSALDADGKPIAATYLLPGIAWFDDEKVDLSAGANNYPSIEAYIDVDSAGRSTRCIPAKPKASDAGVCNAFKPGARVSLPLMKDGQPIAGRMTILSTMRIEPRTEAKSK